MDRRSDSRCGSSEYHLAECWELSLRGDPAADPLCAAARKSSTISQLKTNLVRVVEQTSSADAIQFYESFRSVHVRVGKRHYLDVNDASHCKQFSNKI